MFLASWGGSGKEPGSGNPFRVQFPEPGSEGCEREVLKVSVFDGFRTVSREPEVVPGQGSESYCVLRKYILIL